MLGDSGTEAENKESPMITLQKKTLERIGLDMESAFAIDNTDLSAIFDEITVHSLVVTFYTKVFADEHDWFRPLFSLDFTQSVENLSDYILQRVGGNTYFSDRKGFPNLMRRHMHFSLGIREADLWLKYMRESLNELPFSPDNPNQAQENHKKQLFDFLHYTAYFLVTAKEQQEIMYKLGGRY